jgi:hypothetical protein
MNHTVPSGTEELHQLNYYQLKSFTACRSVEFYDLESAADILQQ